MQEDGGQIDRATGPIDVGGLGDRDLLVPIDGTLHLREGADVPFPDSVQAVIAARLDTLPAERKGLLVMGPDCGTAIVGGVPLGFANAVRRGPIGAAWGWGL